MDKIKKILVIIPLIALFATPISSFAATTSTPWQLHEKTWGSSSTTFTVYVKKINFVDTGYGSYKNYNVYLNYACTPGSKVTPGDNTCPDVGYFSYNLPIVSKYSTNSYNYYVYKRSITRTSPLPAWGWRIMVIADSGKFTLLQGDIESIKDGETNIVTFKALGKVSYKKPDDITTSSEEEKNAADLSQKGTAGTATSSNDSDSGEATLTITNQTPTDGTIAETKCDGDTGYTEDGIRYYKNGLLADVPCDTPITTLNQVIAVVKNLLNKILLPISATLFSIMVIFGGVSYITSNGNENQADKAKKILTAAIIGLLITLLAYVLIYFFTNAIGGSIG